MPKYQVGEPDFIRAKKLNSFTLEFSFDGKPSAGQVLSRFIAERDMRVIAMSGSSDIAAAAAAQFNLTDDGVSVANAIWGTAAKVPVGSITPNWTISQGSIVKLVAPNPQDATLDQGTVTVTFSEG